MRQTLFIIITILLLALALRVYRLAEIPPGLTHDEANHGREAIEILDGVLRYYFPLNYGSEPLYSYTVAASMSLLGKNLFALRLVNVLFGLATIAITALWARRAFDPATALASAGLLAVSFWPLASSREALRAGMLPFFLTLAIWFFWRIVCDPCGADNKTRASAGTRSRQRTIGLVLGFALSLVATFHIYLAARVAWLLFPLFMIYLGLIYRSDFRATWRPVLAGLLLAGLLLLPMFLYLSANPFAQTRLSMLNGSIAEVAAGNFGGVAQDASAALLAFVWPGYGDQFLAYNIPGRPVFDPISAVFFVAGLLVTLWRWRQPAYAFLLLWFVTGIIPSLVTGPTANTTRNLAALPAVYLLAAIGFVAAGRYVADRSGLSRRPVLTLGAAVWLAIAGLASARDYFVHWGETAEVRGAYQSTLVEELAYLDARATGEQPVVISTVYPGPAHDASIALVLGSEKTSDYRWADARFALVLPDSERAYALIPSSTPFHPAFTDYLQLIDTVALRPDDLDPEFTLYELDTSSDQTAEQQGPLADFGSAVRLIDALWLAPQAQPGRSAELLTRWEVINPENVGPVHPPTYTTETVFFTHLLDEGGAIVSQRDALDAPSWAWQAGDVILQVHRLDLPPDLPPGTYQPVVGIYDRHTGERLPIHNASGPTSENLFVAPELIVVANS